MLGTVQFGTNYGAFNATGQVSLDKVETMLSAAAEIIEMGKAFSVLIPIG